MVRLANHEFQMCFDRPVIGLRSVKYRDIHVQCAPRDMPSIIHAFAEDHSSFHIIESSTCCHCKETPLRLSVTLQLPYWMDMSGVPTAEIVDQNICALGTLA